MKCNDLELINCIIAKCPLSQIARWHVHSDFGRQHSCPTFILFLLIFRIEIIIYAERKETFYYIIGCNLELDRPDSRTRLYDIVKYLHSFTHRSSVKHKALIIILYLRQSKCGQMQKMSLWNKPKAHVLNPPLDYSDSFVLKIRPWL